ncbi:MAG: hypothetical protein ACR2M4_00585 [Actinomycetota bacterium]
MLNLLTAAESIPGLPEGLAGLGIVAIALLVGQIVTYRYVLIPERDRANKNEAEIQRLNTLAIDRLIPTMVTVTATLAETQELIETLAREARK